MEQFESYFLFLFFDRWTLLLHAFQEMLIALMVSCYNETHSTISHFFCGHLCS